MPSTLLPLAYYLVAYAGFGGALLVLAIEPALPGASFYHSRFVALVHLLTLAWLTGSILGSIYIVGPLALRLPMPVGKMDAAAFGSFVLGTSGMAWSAALVTLSILWVGVRVLRGLRPARIPSGVRLHVALAFFNIVTAAGLGMLIGFDRARGFLSASPLSIMFAHAHIAAIGWVTMLVIGLSYRLMPMMLPAAMPSGRSLATSAILLECGLVILSVCFIGNISGTWVGASLIAAGIASFIAQVRRMLRHRLPRPPALPVRDWAAWQVHMAVGWLLVAVMLGLVLVVTPANDDRVAVMWVYGVAGLVGFLAQMVAGMQGRLVPLYAWYRAYAATGAPQPRAASALPSTRFARPIFLCWAAAVPLLAWGLAFADQFAIRTAAVSLLGGLGLGGSYVIYMLRRARASTGDEVAVGPAACELFRTT